MSNPVVIAEEYKLPSLGKVYSTKVNPEVKIRSMTTEEEMKRLSPSEKIYKNLCDIIDDCLLEDPGISAYDMCLADYQYLLHKLRIVTYGTTYPVSSVCPHCYSENDSTIELDKMDVKTVDINEFTKLSKFKLPKTGKEITIKIQTPRMADNVNTQAKELQKKSHNTSGDAVFLFTLQNLIDTVDGETLDFIQKEDFVRKLPMMDTNYLMKHAQKLVESFGLDTKLNLTCPNCGLDYNSSFRITSEFFGPSIDI